MSTLKEIANKASVSTSTVSRVLSGDSTISVSPETRDRILSVAEELNYRISPLKNSNNLGTIAITSWNTKKPSMTDLYFKSISWGAETALKGKGYTVIQSIFNETTPNPSKVDGIIALGEYSKSHLEILKNLNKPLVVINQDTLADGISCIKADYKDSVEEVLNFFMSKGYTKIGLLTGIALHHPNIADPRAVAFRDFMKLHGLLDDRFTFEGDFSINSGYKQMELAITNLGEELPEAFFIASDTMAIGAIKALNDHQIKVPERVNIFGFGDLDVAEYTVPSLSTVSLATRQMGASAVMVLENIMTGVITAPIKVVTSNKLIFRNSTDNNGKLD